MSFSSRIWRRLFLNNGFGKGIKRASDDLSFYRRRQLGHQKKQSISLYFQSSSEFWYWAVLRFSFFRICYHTYLLNQYELLNGMPQGLHMSTVIVYTDFNICYLQILCALCSFWDPLTPFLKIKWLPIFSSGKWSLKTQTVSLSNSSRHIICISVNVTHSEDTE